MKLSDSFTKKLNQEQLAFLQDFFLHCPDSFLSNLMLKSYPANVTLMSTDDSCSHIYILLNGRLQGIEEQASDTEFRFAEISAIEIIGDFELFSQASARFITLTTLERSLCVMIPAKAYLAWIKEDAHALFIRIQMLVTQWMTQTRSDRKNFFLDNRTRLLQLLYHECSLAHMPEDRGASGKDCPPRGVMQSGTPFEYKIRDTRSTIAARMGCSVRTVNRVAAQLCDEGYISLVHGKIRVSQTQFAEIEAELRDCMML